MQRKRQKTLPKFQDFSGHGGTGGGLYRGGGGPGAGGGPDLGGGGGGNVSSQPFSGEQEVLRLIGVIGAGYFQGFSTFNYGGGGTGGGAFPPGYSAGLGGTKPGRWCLID